MSPTTVMLVAYARGETWHFGTFAYHAGSSLSGRYVASCGADRGATPSEVVRYEPLAEDAPDKPLCARCAHRGASEAAAANNMTRRVPKPGRR